MLKCDISDDCRNNLLSAANEVICSTQIMNLLKTVFNLTKTCLIKILKSLLVLNGLINNVQYKETNYISLKRSGPRRAHQLYNTIVI